jgi:membrane-associated phospholipid phosphatase
MFDEPMHNHDFEGGEMNLSRLSMWLFVFTVLLSEGPVGQARVLHIGEPSTSVGDTHKSLLFDTSDDSISGDMAFIPSEESSYQRPSVVKALRDDIVFLLKQPDFYAVIGGLSIASSFIEYESTAINRKWMRSVNADRFFEAGEIMGDAAFPFAIALVTYSLGERFHSPKAVSFASDLFRANAINSILTVSMKISMNRKRPDGAPYSFPSGHASHAFATAGVIHGHYGPWWGILSEVVAAYVGLSRLQENKHYLSDVIGGALLGSYVAYKITHRVEGFRGIEILPVIEDKTYGMGLTLRF